MWLKSRKYFKYGGTVILGRYQNVDYAHFQCQQFYAPKNVFDKISTRRNILLFNSLGMDFTEDKFQNF